MLGGDGGEGHDGGEVFISNKDKTPADQHQGNQCTSICCPSIGGGGGIGGSTTDNADVVKATQFSIGALKQLQEVEEVLAAGVVNLGKLEKRSISATTKKQVLHQ